MNWLACVTNDHGYSSFSSKNMILYNKGQMSVIEELAGGGRVAEHSEIHFSTLETRSRISSFQSHASRRDREFLSFSLVLRDEIENFCLSVSCFETRSRISVFRSRASRRDREFLSFDLVLRDKIENF